MPDAPPPPSAAVQGPPAAGSGGSSIPRAGRAGPLVVVPTGAYWVVLIVSLLFLLVAVGFYDPELDKYVPFLASTLRFATVVLAVCLIAWSAVALLHRGRVVHRTLAAARGVTTGAVEGMRAQSEAREGAWERMAARWARRLQRLGRVVLWLVLLPWRIVTWTWYNAEALAWHLVLVAYDLLYYPTYAAWLLVHWALRTSLRIIVFALRVAWTVLRLPTRLPLLRTLWARRYRPRILARWNGLVAQYEHGRAVRLDRGRRRAHLRGEDPDRWEADHRLRRGFPLPHPDKGRVYIRRRIARIREIQRARREGRPVPRRTRTPPHPAPEPPAPAAPLSEEPTRPPANPTADKAPPPRPRRLGGRRAAAPAENPRPATVAQNPKRQRPSFVRRGDPPDAAPSDA